MSDYAKIADALRFTASAISDHKLEVLSLRTLNDGATAIEELTAQVRDKDYLIQQQADEIERLRRDVKKQQEKMIELAKKLPKRGEWIRVQEVDIPGEMHPAAFKCMCSVCRNEYLFPRIPRYCPDCGSMNTAKMEVQDEA